MTSSLGLSPMTETPELLACPFCGGEARLVEYKSESLYSHDIVGWSHVECRECDVDTHAECDEPDGERAVDKSVEHWNTRAARSSGEAAPADACIHGVYRAEACERCIAASLSAMQGCGPDCRAEEQGYPAPCEMYPDQYFAGCPARNAAASPSGSPTAGGEEPEMPLPVALGADPDADNDPSLGDEAFAASRAEMGAASTEPVAWAIIQDGAVLGVRIDEADAEYTAGSWSQRPDVVPLFLASLSSSGSPASPLSEEERELVEELRSTRKQSTHEVFLGVDEADALLAIIDRLSHPSSVAGSSTTGWLDANCQECGAGNSIAVSWPLPWLCGSCGHSLITELAGRSSGDGA